MDFSQQTNTVSCLAGVTSNLQDNHTVTLMGDGEELRISMRGENITQELQPATSYEDFTCRVCINIREAGIEDYCSSRDLVVSGSGKCCVYKHRFHWHNVYSFLCSTTHNHIKYD